MEVANLAIAALALAAIIAGLVFVLSSIRFVTRNIGGGHPVSYAFSALVALAFLVAAMKLIRKLN